jgi:hypothetical protein
MRDEGGPVDPLLADSIQRFIEAAIGDYVLKVEVEIQDGGLFLLVVAMIDKDTPAIQVSRLLELASTELSRRIPARSDDYAWILIIKHGAEILESRSGGWKGQSDV